MPVTAYVTVTLSAILATAMLLFAFREYGRLRRARPLDRIAHAYWLMLALAIAAGLISILLWTLDGRQRHLPPAAWPFVGVAIALYVLAFAVRITGGGWLQRWLETLPTPRR